MSNAFLLALLVGLVGLCAEALAGPETIGMVTPVMAVFGLLSAEVIGIIWLGWHHIPKQR